MLYVRSCAMPSKSLPISMEEAFAMDLGKFVGAVDEGHEGNTAEVVVALLEKNFIRSNRRLASTSVSSSFVRVAAASVVSPLVG